MVNIIGDIAGQYDAMLRLLQKMPDEETISVGDMIDRGPKSKDVVEWFMKNGKAVLGNHDHMMLDAVRGSGYYEEGLWCYNGGMATLNSFGGRIPDEVLTWVENLPLYMEIDGNLVSHSFPYWYGLEESCDLGVSIQYRGERTIIWNRDRPVRFPEYKMQIAGHNSQWGLRRFSDDKGEYAVCIDDSRNKKLTGIHLPSYKVYQVDVNEVYAREREDVVFSNSQDYKHQRKGTDI
jgi:hypothetical protein